MRTAIIASLILVIIATDHAKAAKSTKIMTSVTINRLDDASFKEGAKIGFICTQVSKPRFRSMARRPKIIFESLTIVHKSKITIEGGCDYDFVCRRDPTCDVGDVRPVAEVEAEVEAEEVTDGDYKIDDYDLVDQGQSDCKSGACDPEGSTEHEEETTTTEETSSEHGGDDEPEEPTEPVTPAPGYEYCFDGLDGCEGEELVGKEKEKAAKYLNTKINVVNVMVSQRGNVLSGKIRKMKKGAKKGKEGGKKKKLLRKKV